MPKIAKGEKCLAFIESQFVTEVAKAHDEAVSTCPKKSGVVFRFHRLLCTRNTEIVLLSRGLAHRVRDDLPDRVETMCMSLLGRGNLTSGGHRDRYETNSSYWPRQLEFLEWMRDEGRYVDGDLLVNAKNVKDFLRWRQQAGERSGEEGNKDGAIRLLGLVREMPSTFFYILFVFQLVIFAILKLTEKKDFCRKTEGKKNKRGVVQQSSSRAPSLTIFF